MKVKVSELEGRALNYAVAFCLWGKYGGRVVADVVQIERNLAQDLIVRGLGREYNGSARKGWCDE